MSDTLDFIKGHCGWDVLTLVLAEQVPTGQEFETALKIVDSPVGGGIEVGIMYPPDSKGAIPIKILNAAERNWIPMCGGMTQVIGKAMAETFLGDYYAVDKSKSEIAINLQTDSCIVPIHTRVKDNRAHRITTVMDNYIDYLNDSGIEMLSVLGVRVARVGCFLIIKTDDLQKQHPDIDFASRCPGQHWDILNDIHQVCKRDLGRDEELYIMLYDKHPEGPGQARFFPRFYAENPWEFQCGTG